jgi:hypothetical protein
MAAGVILAAAAAKRRKEVDAAAIARCEESWKPVADKVELTFSVEAGKPLISGRHRGIECSLGIELDRYGYAHTRAIATPLKTVECHAGVVPNPGGALGFLKSLVAQDILVGDPPFDDAFLIQGKPVELVVSLLDVALRDRLTTLATHKLTAFTYEPGKVVVQLPNVELDAEWLEAALEVVVEAGRWSPRSAEPFR